MKTFESFSLASLLFLSTYSGPAYASFKQNVDSLKQPDASVSYIDFKTRIYGKSLCDNEHLLQTAYLFSTVNHVNPFLTISMIETESKCQQYVTSRVGARGYMQIMPIAEKEYLRLGGPRLHANSFDMRYNISMGTFLINGLITKYDDVHGALVAYNGGSGLYNKLKATGRPVESGYSREIVNRALLF